MEKLDRLGWAAGLSFNAYGLHIGVRVNDAQAVERLTECLPPGWQAATSTEVNVLYSLFLGGTASRPNIRRYNLLYEGAGLIGRTLNLDEIFTTLESQLQLLVAEHAPDRVFVHSGVVGWQGRAILVPGASFSGKSRLVKALVRAGATYYSDEYAVLDEQGLVHPFPRPISLRDEWLRKSSLAVPGETSSRPPLPVGLVAVTEYKAGARWRPRRLTAGKALVFLMACSMSGRKRPEFTLRTLTRTVEGAITLKSKRGEADEVVDALLKAAEAPVPALAPIERRQRLATRGDQRTDR